MVRSGLAPPGEVRRSVRASGSGVAIRAWGLAGALCALVVVLLIWFPVGWKFVSALFLFFLNNYL